MKLFDTHAHYNDDRFIEDYDDIIEQIFNTEVDKLACVGVNEETSQKAIEIAKSYSNIYAIIGISPQEAPNNSEEVEKIIEKIEKLANEEKVVAIGEIGLDYHYEGYDKKIQKELFEKQIILANKLNLPIAIHSRDAWIDTIDILKQTKCNNTGVFHCCQLNMELVKEALKLGYYISFAGTITFKNVKNAKQIIEMVPLDRILIETDSPYLAPEPVRGTRNDSRNVKYIAQKIAEYKNMELTDIAEITYNNAKKLFKLKKV